MRVHPELLAQERLPPQLLKHHVWRKRFDDVNSFEQPLAKNDMVILKFFLNVSRQEQKRRFLERLDSPAKRWKFSSSDIAEGALWPTLSASVRGDGPGDQHADRPLVRGAG